MKFIHYSLHEFEHFFRDSLIDFIGKLQLCNAEMNVLRNDQMFREYLESGIDSTTHSIRKGIMYKGRTTDHYFIATQRCMVESWTEGIKHLHDK
jgi:hypothetical protein